MQLDEFQRWVVDNRIDYFMPTISTKELGFNYNISGIYAVDAASLVKVFENVFTANRRYTAEHCHTVKRRHASKHRRIFISMQFGNKTNKTYETIDKTIHNVNEKHKLGIKLRTKRIDKHNTGHSYNIDREIFTAIKDAGLLVADLTYSNPNVYHEVGYLMGINEGRNQKQDNFILIVNTNEHSEDDISFNLRHWKQLRFETHPQLEKELTTWLETYYRLL